MCVARLPLRHGNWTPFWSDLIWDGMGWDGMMCTRPERQSTQPRQRKNKMQQSTAKRSMTQQEPGVAELTRPASSPKLQPPLFGCDPRGVDLETQLTTFGTSRLGSSSETWVRRTS